MNIEIRTDGVLHIDGYVNAVERDSREILTKEGRCVERVLPGVFGKALASAEEVRMLLNHRSDRQLASTKDTLVLEEDAIGLRATADITDEEVIEKARLGKLKGWSFGFRANDTAMESRANSVPRRILKDISLFEVSVIDDEHNPCYKSTSLNCEFRAEDDIELRTDEKILDEFREQWYNEYYLPRYYRFLEVRFNPYHDTDNGRFTTSAGGGNGWVVYSKGGKSRYQPVNGGNTEADIDEMYENEKGSVANCKDFESLEKHMKDKWNIEISEDVKNLNFEAVKTSLTGIEGVLKQYPAMAEGLNKIITKDAGMMCCNPSGYIAFNPSYYGGDDAMQRLQRSVDRSVATGHWPKGYTIESIAAHEAGHALANYISKNTEGYRWWDHYKQQKEIVSESIKQVKGTKEFRKQRINQVIESLSGYAASYSDTDIRAAETIAESVADTYNRGDNSHPLSKAVMSRINSQYNEIVERKSKKEKGTA